MLISEIYESRQGEGRLTGTPSVFVRTSGCNLRCSFCDTPFTSWEPAGTPMTVAQVVERVGQFTAQHVVITGGEPMLSREIVELSQAIQQKQLHITIETAGTIFRDVCCDLMSISPKLSNSTPAASRAGEWREKHENTRNQPEVINRLIQSYDYQLKYVVAHPVDVNEIQIHLSRLENWTPERVCLMPEGVNQEELDLKQEWLQPLCAKLGFVFCPRMHIQWYGNTRGT
jgi:7-carboxy-7-deazaguanine synthase